MSDKKNLDGFVKPASEIIYIVIWINPLSLFKRGWREMGYIHIMNGYAQLNQTNI